ncbi:MAG: hypothetical protein WC749_05970 [Dehalococcoidia bacterium]
MKQLDEIKQLLSKCSQQERRQIFEYLRAEFPIHPIEAELNTQAEVILEAIHRASDLTQRGVRGVIAEAAFEMAVVKQLNGWNNLPGVGNVPFDFLLADTIGEVRLQLKMQRKKSQRPMMANEAYKWLPSNMYVVETQRTRGGSDPKTGQDTRPYKFGEFDILVVSMHPSTNKWGNFMYTVAAWLLPREEDKNLLLKFQPVPKVTTDDWTDDLETCIQWFRSSTKKRISI